VVLNPRSQDACAVHGLTNGRTVCINLDPTTLTPVRVVDSGALWPNYAWSSAATYAGNQSLTLLPGEWLTVVIQNAPGLVTVAASEKGVVQDSTTAIKLSRESTTEVAGDQTRQQAAKTQVFHFAPRKMGAVWSVSLAVDGKANTVPAIELAVKNVYIGAVRLGVSGLYTAANHYAEVAYPGTGAKVLQNMSEGWELRPELVVGYAGFFAPRTYTFGERFGWTGRRKGRGWEYISQHFAGYLGLGVLAADGADILPLSSVYLGVEWEPAPDFSITPTLALRRGERLNPPYQEGDRLPSGTTVASLTTMTANIGFGLVVSVSPRFFRTQPKIARFVPDDSPDEADSNGGEARPAAPAESQNKSLPETK